MILDIIKTIFKPVVKLADKLIPDKDKRAQFQHVLDEARVEYESKILEYELKLMQAQASVIQKEAGGTSWLQRNWRPLTMITFLGVIVHNMVVVPIFGLTPASMDAVPDKLWDLMLVGIGGYIVGRSGERIAKNLKRN